MHTIKTKHHVGANMNITILGTGFAALTAVKKTRKEAPAAKITVIAPSKELVYLPSIIWIPANIRPGLLFLSVLPTTILSSTVFTANSNGDAAAALFSATFSNLIGVLATPFWCLALFSTANSAFPPVGSLIAKIALYILLPIAVGQILRQWKRLQPFAQSRLLKRLNNGLILFIIYAAFCDSFTNDVWSGFSPTSFAAASLIATLFLVALSILVWVTSPLSSTKFDQRIAAFFCGSQKTPAARVFWEPQKKAAIL